MLVAFSTPQDDISFHHGADDPYPPLHALAYGRYLRTRTPTKQLLRPHNDAYPDIRGVKNSEIATFFRGLAERPLMVFPSAATLPFCLQRWLATYDSDDEGEDTYPPPTFDRNSTKSDTDYGSCTLDHSHDSPVGSQCVTRPFSVPLTAEKPVSSDEPFEEEAIAFASEYLNLDYETSTFADHAGVAEPVSSSTSSDSSPSSSPNNTAGEVGLPWGIEPTSLPLLDTTKFEIEIDANGVQTRNPWPWGDYTYQPPNPTRSLDFEEYTQEHRLAKIEEKLRIRLSERFAEKAIRGGRKARAKGRREKKKGKRVEKENSSPIVAFSQVIRGRTIYNP